MQSLTPSNDFPIILYCVIKIQMWKKANIQEILIMRRKWILSSLQGFAPMQMTRLERTLLMGTLRCPPLLSILKSQMAETALPPACESLCHMTHLIMAGMEICPRENSRLGPLIKEGPYCCLGNEVFENSFLKKERNIVIHLSCVILVNNSLYG